MSKGKSFVVIMIILLSSSLLTANSETEEKENNAFFDLSFLVPTSCCWSNPFASNLAKVLPEIGVNVSNYVSGWSTIIPRIWSYPVGEEGYYDYIPTYEEGGYDVMFVAWGWPLDWNPTLFDSASIVPNGDNAYQYNNTKFDALLEEYVTEYDKEKRNEIVKKLQAILYEDLPAITFTYPRSLYVTRTGVEGIDTVLISAHGYRAEYWENGEKSTFVYGTPFSLNHFSIFRNYFYKNTLWMQAVYYGLFERKQESHIYEPVIAQNYSVSEDKRAITITINPNARFSNGDPVTAEDIKYTYQLFMTPLIDFDDYDFLTYHFESNESIQIIDNSTIRFQLKEPYAFYYNLLTYGIINRKLVEPYIEENGYDSLDELNNSLLTSCGPFMVHVEDFDLERNIVTLQKNPYWQNLTGVDPFLDEITFQYIQIKDDAITSLLNGSIDMIDNDFFLRFEDLVDENNSTYEGINLMFSKEPVTYEMMINMRHPIIGTGELTPKGTAEAAKALRKAISHASDRQKMISEFNYSYTQMMVPGVTPMPEACVGYDSSLQPYKYNLTLAKQYIEDAGYTYEEPTTTTTFAFGIFLMNFLGLSSLTLLLRRKKK
ncbi:MAG: ABC transporter substrate-binding protein [Candidatus Heimdallarchaeaceae archaeon]